MSADSPFFNSPLDSPFEKSKSSQAEPEVEFGEEEEPNVVFQPLSSLRTEGDPWSHVPLGADEKEQLSFRDVDTEDAKAFVYLPHRVQKSQRSGCFAFMPTRTEHNFWVDTKIEALRWDSHTKKIDEDKHHKVFLADIHHIQAYVLDHPPTNEARNNTKRKPSLLSSRLQHGSASSMTLASRWMLQGGPDLDFDVLYKDEALGQGKLRLRARSRRELKLWVTGLESLLYHRLHAANWMNIDAMSRRMFHKADVDENGTLDKDEVKLLLINVGKFNKERMQVHFEAVFKKFDKDGDGTIDEDEFSFLFQSFLVKSSLRKYFHDFIDRDFSLEHASSIAAAKTLRPQSTITESTDNSHARLSQTTTTTSNTNISHRQTQASIGFEVPYPSFPVRSDRHELLTFTSLCKFLQEVQHESGATNESAKQVIEFVRELPGAHRAVHPRYCALTEVGFSILMCSSANLLIDPVKTSLYHDMSLPLSSYWINSSHNTYLEGKQIGGVASVAQYLEVLRQGCRCVEMDCWDGPDGEPVITHRYTSTPWIKFEDVIRACCDFAFAHSDFPLIISLEQHCSDEQKAKIGLMMSQILGNSLLRIPREGIEQAPLVSPESAKRKFIVKAKLTKISSDPSDESSDDEADEDEEEDKYGSYDKGAFKDPNAVKSSASSLQGPKSASPSLPGKTGGSMGSSSLFTASVGSDGEGTDEKGSWGLGNATKRIKGLRKNKDFRGTESKGSVGLSIRDSKTRDAWVRKGLIEYNRCIYLQVKKFENEQVPRYGSRLPCNCASFKDPKMRECVRRYGPLVNVYHQDCLTRVYPGLGSSNPLPMVHWVHGAQLVALNYQNRDEAMLLNAGMFRHRNGGCGYVRKSCQVQGAYIICKRGHRMVHKRDDDAWECLNAREDLVEGCRGGFTSAYLGKGVPRFNCVECNQSICMICANKPVEEQKPLHLHFRVISAHFLPNPQLYPKTPKHGGESTMSPFIRVKIHGAKEDNAHKDTKIHLDNGFDPEWDEVLEFTIKRPDVAIITIQVFDTVSKQVFVAASAFPVAILREGVRWVPLWDIHHRAIENCGVLAELRFLDSDQFGHFISLRRASTKSSEIKGASRKAPLLHRLSQTDLGLVAGGASKMLRNSLVKSTQEATKVIRSSFVMPGPQAVNSAVNASTHEPTGNSSSAFLRTSLSNMFTIRGGIRAPRNSVVDNVEEELGMEGTSLSVIEASASLPLSLAGISASSSVSTQRVRSASSLPCMSSTLSGLQSRDLSQFLEVHAGLNGRATGACRNHGDSDFNPSTLVKSHVGDDVFSGDTDDEAEDTEQPFDARWHASAQPLAADLTGYDRPCCQENSDNPPWCCSAQSSQVGARI